jgi:hypothetical protein
MDSLPCAQKRFQILYKSALNVNQIARGKAVILPQGDRAYGIVQCEDSLVTVPNDVHMSRAMVIRINCHL